MLKRWIAMLLAIAMCMSLLPVTALGAEVESEISELGGVAETTPVQDSEIEIPAEVPETEAAETEAAETEAVETEPEETEALETEPAETEETEAVLCAHGAEADCAVCALESRIAALPQADALAELSEEEKAALLEELAALLEAYDALSEEEKALVTGFEKVAALFDALTVQETAVEEAYGEISVWIACQFDEKTDHEEVHFTVGISGSETQPEIENCEYTLQNADGVLIDTWTESGENALTSVYPAKEKGVGGDLLCSAVITLAGGTTIETTEPSAFCWRGTDALLTVGANVESWSENDGYAAVGEQMTFDASYYYDPAENATAEWTLEKFNDETQQWIAQGTVEADLYKCIITATEVGLFRVKVVYRVPGEKPAVYTKYSSDVLHGTYTIVEGNYIAFLETNWNLYPSWPIVTPLPIWVELGNDQPITGVKFEIYKQGTSGRYEEVVWTETVSGTECTWTPDRTDERLTTGKYMCVATVINPSGYETTKRFYFSLAANGWISSMNLDCDAKSVVAGEPVTVSFEAGGTFTDLSYTIVNNSGDLEESERYSKVSLDVEDREFMVTFDKAGSYQIKVQAKDGEVTTEQMMFITVQDYSEVNIWLNGWPTKGDADEYSYAFYVQMSEWVTVTKTEFFLSNADGKLLDQWSVEGDSCEYPIEANGVGGDLSCYAVVTLANGETVQTEPYTFQYNGLYHIWNVYSTGSDNIAVGGTLSFRVSADAEGFAPNATYTWTMEKKNGNGEWVDAGLGTKTTKESSTFTMKTAGTYRCKLVYRVPGTRPAVYTRYSDECGVLSGSYIQYIYTNAPYGVPGEPMNFDVHFSGEDAGGSLKFQVIKEEWDSEASVWKDNVLYEENLGSATKFTWTPADGMKGSYEIRAVYTNSAGEVSTASRWMDVISGGRITALTARGYTTDWDNHYTVLPGEITFDIETLGDVDIVSCEVEKEANNYYGNGEELNLEASDRSFTYNFTSPGDYRIYLTFKNADQQHGDFDLFLTVGGKVLTGESEILAGEDVGDTWKVEFETAGTGNVKTTYAQVLYCETNVFQNEYWDGATEVKKWGSNNKSTTVTFTPKAEGFYLVYIQMQDATGAYSYAQMIIPVGSLKFADLTADVDGKTVTFTSTFTAGEPKDGLVSYRVERHTPTGWYEVSSIEDGKPVQTITLEEAGEYKARAHACSEVEGVCADEWIEFTIENDTRKLTGITLKNVLGEVCDTFSVGEEIQNAFTFDKDEGELGEIRYLILRNGSLCKPLAVCEDGTQIQDLAFTEPGEYDIIFAQTDAEGVQWGDKYASFTVQSEHIHRYKRFDVEAVEATPDKPGNKAYSYLHCELYCVWEYADMNGKKMTMTQFGKWEGTTQQTYVTATGVDILYEDETVSGETLTFDLADVDENGQPVTHCVLSANVLPGMGAYQNVKWTSSNPKVAKVDSGESSICWVDLGIPGTAKITAKTADGKHSAAVTLKVIYRYDFTKLTIGEVWGTEMTGIPTNTIQLGDSRQLFVAVDEPEQYFWVDSNLMDITVSNGNSWMPGTPSGMSTEMFTIFGEKLGTVTVTASLKGDPLNRKVTYTAKVVPPMPTEASVTWANDAELAENGYITTPGFKQASDNAYNLYLHKSSVNQVYTLNLVGSNRDLAPEMKDYNFTWKTVSGKGASAKMDVKTGDAAITVNANTVGQITLAATAKNNPQLTVTVNVIVEDYAPKLAATSVSLNAAEEAPSAVIGVTESELAQVKSAALYEYNKVTKKYDIESELGAIYDPETKEVTITCERGTAAGSRKVELALITEHDVDNRALVTVTIKSVLPKVTVKQIGKVNLKGLRIESQLAITVPEGEKITGVEMNVEGYMLVEEDGVYSIIAKDGATLKNNKGTIQIRAEGYGVPVYNMPITIAVVDAPIAATLNSCKSGAQTEIYAPGFVSVKITGVKLGKNDVDETPFTLEDGYLKVSKTLDAGTYIIDIEADEIDGENVRTFPSQVKLTVQNVLPAVTIKQVNRLNLQALNCESELQITTKDGSAVTEVELDGCGYTVEKREDGSFWLLPGEGADAKNTKGTLDITVEGYNAFPKAFSVTTESKAFAQTLNTNLTEKSFTLPMLEDVTVNKMEVKSKGNAVEGAFSWQMTKDELVITAEKPLDNGTYNLTVYAEQNGREFTCLVNVTVKNTLPAVTVKQTQKDNLLDPNGYGILIFTGKDIVVEDVQVEGEADYRVDAGEDGEYRLVIADPANRVKPNTKVNVAIKLVGYDVPVMKTVAVATEKVANKVTAGRAPVLYRAMPGFDVGVPLNTTYEGSKVQSVAIKEAYDWLDWKLWTVNDLTEEEREEFGDRYISTLVFKFKEGADLPKAGSYRCTVTPTDSYGNVLQPVTITVKLEEKPKMIVSPTTVPLSIAAGSTEVSVTDYYGMYMSTTFAVEEKYADDLTVTYGGHGKLEIALTEETTFRPGSYKVKLIMMLGSLELDPVTITVKVTQ